MHTALFIANIYEITYRLSIDRFDLGTFKSSRWRSCILLTWVSRKRTYCISPFVRIGLFLDFSRYHAVGNSQADIRTLANSLYALLYVMCSFFGNIYLCLLKISFILTVLLIDRKNFNDLFGLIFQNQKVCNMVIL